MKDSTIPVHGEFLGKPVQPAGSAPGGPEKRATRPEKSQPTNMCRTFPDNSLLRSPPIDRQHRQSVKDQSVIDGGRPSLARKATVFPVLSQVTGIFPETG